MPTAVLIGLVLVALVLLAALIALRLGRYPTSRFAPFRASAAEASDRTSDLAAEFFEWLRTGR